MSYTNASLNELKALETALESQFESVKAQGLKLNMARGKPGADQLDLSTQLLTVLNSGDDCFAQSGTDCRNYGLLEGIPEARELMASMLDDSPDNVIVGGNSSLSLMYDTIARFLNFGSLGSKPWFNCANRKWICLVPGYDRHFAITQGFGFQNIPVPLTDDGPDMDAVEELVCNDASVKGIWCVPKYSNPSGVSYSKQVVERLANMKCAAPDFRIMWDNAYCVHHLYDENEQDELYDIALACKQAGNIHRYIKFASTSKVTLPGAGIAALAASPENCVEIKSHMTLATISGDKLNQLRHVRFLRNEQGIAEHMKRHAEILRPKFALVEEKLSSELADLEECAWSKPRGGYFVSFDAPQGTASHIVALAREAGVVLTGAGATWPGGQDPCDSNIRIAPTLPPLSELECALDVFCCCVKLAYVKKLIAQHL